MNANIRRWGLRLGADSKKISVVVVLLAFGLLLWGRLLLQEVPRSASARPTTSKLANEQSRVTATSDAAAVKVRIVRVDLPRDLSRDLFTFDSNPYKRTPDNDPSARNAKLASQQSDELTWDELTRLARTLLTLDSVVTQPRPYAVINGQLLMPGQSVEGFKLRAVEDRSVILEKDGITIRLKM